MLGTPRWNSCNTFLYAAYPSKAIWRIYSRFLYLQFWITIIDIHSQPRPVSQTIWYLISVGIGHLHDFVKDLHQCRQSVYKMVIICEWKIFHWLYSLHSHMLSIYAYHKYIFTDFPYTYLLPHLCTVIGNRVSVGKRITRQCALSIISWVHAWTRTPTLQPLFLYMGLLSDT